MKLRNRLILSVGITLVCLLLVITPIATTLFLRGFTELEQRDARVNARQAERAIYQQAADLHDQSIGWAWRDDTYAFMQTRNPAYIQSNLTGNTLVSTRLDIILYLTPQGRIFYARPVSRLPQLAPPSAKEVQATVWRAISKESKSAKRNGLFGVGASSETPLLLSARPILTSRARGAIRGWLVFGRYFDSAEMQRLNERIQMNMALFPLAIDDLPSVERRAANQLARQQYYTHVESGTEIEGYTHLKDLNGNPTHLLKVTLPRPIHHHGLSYAQRLGWSVVLMAVLVGGIILGVVEYTFLRRLSKLRNQVKELGATEGFGQRVRLLGGDELSDLAKYINEMLAALEAHLDAHRKQVKVHNENMERIVQERTRQLALKNAVLENAVEGIAELDTQGRYISVNTAYAQLLGYAPEALRGLAWEMTLALSEHLHMRNVLTEMEEKGKMDLEAKMLRHDNSYFFAQMTLIAVYAPPHRLTGYHCFIKDISERKEMETRIFHQAFHDALTGLPNRLLLHDRIEHAIQQHIRHSRRLAIMFIDLDNFKYINDSLGHEEGDHLLMVVAQRLQECMRMGDTVARLGGDEFAALLENLPSEDEGILVAERLVDALRQPIRLQNQEHTISASVGIVFSTDNHIQTEALLRDADTAMYEAKAKGKARYVVFEQSMNERIQERMELENGLRKALEQDELRLIYQPIINLQTGKVEGAEALMRWNHPRYGLLSPARFIPVAEESELIELMGVWALKEGCRQAIQWHKQHPDHKPLTVSVNLSARQLQRADLVETVAETLRETGLSAQCLILEITESMMLLNTDMVLERLHALKALGVKIAMDDFGAGYSSLSYLQRLPLDKVKIDRAFVSEMETDIQPATIVQTIIRMCRALQMQVTAEGVETSLQVELLWAMGCEFGQGYYFSVPLPGPEFLQWAVLYDSSQHALQGVAVNANLLLDAAA